MAYLTILQIDCEYPDSDCVRDVTHNLYNRHGKPCGKFCKEHAEQMLKALNALEAAAEPKGAE